MTGNEYRVKIERLKGRKQQLETDLENVSVSISDLGRQSVYCEQAQVIIQEVAQLTQEQLQYQVSELVTLALASVFENPYELELEFVQRRGRTEADLWFVRDGKRINPMEASGGGAVDVAAFALRIALWSLAKPRTRNTLILDEPLKFLKGGELPEKGALMIKEISERIGLQIIMVSHIPDQIEGADQRISVSNRKGVSRASIY